MLGLIVAAEELGGAAAWGVILTGGAIGGLLGGVLALRLTPSRPVPLAFVAWSLGSLPLLALVPPLPTLVIATTNVAFAFGIVYGNTIWETLQQREILAERLSPGELVRLDGLADLHAGRPGARRPWPRSSVPTPSWSERRC